MLNEFRQFLLRGNVVDLAVAVVVGAAFGAVVTALVSSFITPLIALVGGQPDFSALRFTIGGTVFPYGQFVTALVSFLIIAAVVFFLVVRPVNALMARMRTEPDVATPVRPCPHCLSDVPEAATRCAFCTSEIAPGGRHAGAPA